ncbi:phospholipid-transporting ATPase 2-like, partial [Trifolium medium]|nr:phospholipid-transporting ATPase 2-like [Trifolium medium]
KTGDILYKAQSQDEDALVQAAAQLHMVFFNKSGNILEVKFNTSILQYEVLETLEFTSDRKRMSVVLKDCQNGKILLLSKGADEAILPHARAVPYPQSPTSLYFSSFHMNWPAAGLEPVEVI